MSNLGNKCAFPSDGTLSSIRGMSFRQYVATQALKGMLSNSNIASGAEYVPASSAPKIASAAVFYADALIAELEKV